MTVYEAAERAFEGLGDFPFDEMRRVAEAGVPRAMLCLSNGLQFCVEHPDLAEVERLLVLAMASSDRSDWVHMVAARNLSTLLVCTSADGDEAWKRGLDLSRYAEDLGW